MASSAPAPLARTSTTTATAAASSSSTAAAPAYNATRTIWTPPSPPCHVPSSSTAAFPTAHGSVWPGTHGRTAAPTGSTTGTSRITQGARNRPLPSFGYASSERRSDTNTGFGILYGGKSPRSSAAFRPWFGRRYRRVGTETSTDGMKSNRVAVRRNLRPEASNMNESGFWILNGTIPFVAGTRKQNG